MKVIRKDFKTAGIPLEDERGHRVDFHALRMTYMAERGGFEPHKIPPIIRETRTTTHKETHKFQSRQAPNCPK